jgi:hypothetical protein
MDAAAGDVLRRSTGSYRMASVHHQIFSMILSMYDRRLAEQSLYDAATVYVQLKGDYYGVEN